MLEKLLFKGALSDWEKNFQLRQVIYSINEETREYLFDDCFSITE